MLSHAAQLPASSLICRIPQTTNSLCCKAQWLIRRGDRPLFQPVAYHVPDLPKTLNVQIIPYDRNKGVEFDCEIELARAVAFGHRLMWRTGRHRHRHLVAFGRRWFTI